MENLFLIKLLLSFVVGGLYIALMIWVSERFGSRIGGLLVGLPSTILVSLLFIAWAQDTQTAVSAIPITPAAIAANSLFLVAFIFLYNKCGRTGAFLIAVILWFFLSFPLLFLSLNIFISLILASLYFGVAVCFLRKFPHRKLTKFNLTKKEFLFRIVFAGSFITIAVLLGKLMGPIWGGMFASFPVAFSSSIIILESRYGIEFTSSVARTMPYGSMGAVLFAVVFFFFVPVMGVALGTIIAYLASLIFALVVNSFVLKKEKEFAI